MDGDGAHYLKILLKALGHFSSGNGTNRLTLNKHVAVEDADAADYAEELQPAGVVEVKHHVWQNLPGGITGG